MRRMDPTEYLVYSHEVTAQWYLNNHPGANQLYAWMYAGANVFNDEGKLLLI